MNLPSIRKNLQTFWGFLVLALLFMGLAASVILVTERQEIRKEAVETVVCTWQDNPDINLSHFGRCGNSPVMGAVCEEGQVSVYCTIQDCIIPDQYVQVADCKCICGIPPPSPTPRPTPTQVCTWQDNPDADYNYLAWCGYQPVMGVPCDQEGQRDICTEPCNPGSMVQDFDCKCICDGPMPENCNSECVSQGFASGYCDSANINIICETDETNIGWTQDCVPPPDIPGIFRGCCCVSPAPTPTPTPPTGTPSPSPSPTPPPGCNQPCTWTSECPSTEEIKFTCTHDIWGDHTRKCRNTSCLEEENCICPPPPECLKTCITDADCGEHEGVQLVCGRAIHGEIPRRCVNPDCRQDLDCVCGGATPTPSPTSSPWPTPTPRRTPTPSPTVRPTPSPTPSPTPIGTPTCWLTGDFNCDGEVDLLDFELFRDIYVEHL